MQVVTQNAPKLNDFSNSLRWTIVLLNKGDEVLPNKQSNTPIQNARNFFKVKKWNSYKLFSKTTQNISLSITSNKWQLSNFNIKVVSMMRS